MPLDRETVRGLSQAKAVFRRLPAETQQVYTDVAIAPTAEAIVTVAQSRLFPGHGFRTGQLKKSLGAVVDPKTGSARVGIRLGFNILAVGRTRSGFSHRPTKIGHLVEFGHGGKHKAEATPFMVPAANGQRTPFLLRAKNAGRVLENRMVEVGLEEGALP